MRPEGFKPMCVWQNRLVGMLDETTWAMSRVGAHEDFDFGNIKDNMIDCAVAGNMSVLENREELLKLPVEELLGAEQRYSPPDQIHDIQVIDECRLLFVGEKANWLLCGNPCDNGCITPISKDYKPRMMGVLS